MNTTLDQKRGLIYTAFRDLLGEEQAARAVDFWDTWDDAARTSFTPLRFAQAVQKELGLSTETKRKLIQSMIGYKVSDEHAQSLEEARAPANLPKNSSVPSVAQPASAKPNVAPSIESEQYIVFTALLYPLLTRLRLSERQFLEKMHPKSRTDVKSLLEGSQPMMRNPERVMGNCLDRVYELLCDEYGPVKADQMVARSVAQVERLPEADLFSPRKLL